MAENSKSTRQELRRAKNIVRGAFNRPKSSFVEAKGDWGRAKLSPSDLILGGFSHLDTKEAAKFMEWLKGFPTKAIEVFPVKPVQKAQDLAVQMVTIPLPLVARLHWLSILLEGHQSELAEFVERSTAFEAAYLVGNFEQAQAVLDAIQNQLGFSVWLIECQIALLQRWKGLEAQKDYARSIGASARGRLAGVIAHWVSQRNEESTVFSRYRGRLEKSIEDWSVREPLKDAYAIILGVITFEVLSETRASAALGSLASSSLVDAYNTVLLVLESLFSTPQWQVSVEPLKEIVGRLPVTDTRACNMLALLNRDFASVPRASTSVLDAMTLRSDLSPHGGEVDPSALLDYALADAEFANHSEVRWRSDTPLGDLYRLIVTSIARENAFEAALEQGNKLLTNLKRLPISAAIRGMLVAQDPRYALGSPSVAIQFYLNSRSLHPWHAQCLPENCGLKICRDVFASSVGSQRMADALTGELKASEVSSTALSEFAIRCRLAKEDPHGALAFLQHAIASDDVFARRRLSPLGAAAQLRLGNVMDAIAIAARACAFDSDLAGIMPLQDLVDEARSLSGKSDPLSRAILYDLYLERFDDSEIFQILQFSYEDYVLECGAERPSELPIKQPPGETTKLIYFLRHIAVPEVMDVSFWLFKTSRETVSERIAVCSALVDLDPFNEAIYRDEIKDQTRLLSIQDGLDDVDRSRVFVNIPKLQRWADLELRESFERYQALLRSGVRHENPGDFDKIIKDYAAGKGTLDRFTNYPQDESGQLLLDIYLSIAEKYLHDPDFGLDAYLSMRIRHGSLAGHIRGPLEEQGLLAVRDHGTNQYRMLRTPAAEGNWGNAADMDVVRQRVEDFSRDFDAQIDDLVKARLQIHSSSKQNGLFVFEPSPLIIYFLRANVDEGTQFPAFVDKVIDTLNIYLNISLQNVSKYIVQTFGEAIGKLLEQFRTTIDEGISWQLTNELYALIGKASPDLQASIDRVASWFALDPENQRRTLRTMEQIVDIAIQATNNAHRGVRPVYELDIEDMGLQSNETLLDFTDILFTILDNSYTHSGIDDYPRIRIEISRTALDAGGRARVRICVTNQVARSRKTAASERRLDRIREQIQSGDYRSLSKVEGGTGLLKLKRIVAEDNRQTLDFGYRADSDEFFVEVVMVLVFEEDSGDLSPSVSTGS